MFKLKNDKELAFEIYSVAVLHGFKKAVAVVRKMNPSQTLNLEAIAVEIEYYGLEVK